MLQTIQAKDISLHNLRVNFNLVQTEDEGFFPEWQDDLPQPSEEEKRSLDRLKSNYRNLVEYPPMLEDAVKMVILSPLLDLAGFYQPPSFGLVTNGSEFIFLKLHRQDVPRYALSKVFSLLTPGNELYGVLSVLKRIGAVILDA